MTAPAADLAAGARPALPAAAVMAATVALVLWAGTAIANRFAVLAMDAVTAGALRSALAGAVALAIALLWRLKRPGTARGWLLLIAAGWCNFALWPMLMSVGIGLANASHAALIMALLPVFTGLIAAAVARRRPRTGWWLGAALALAGAFVLIALSRPAGDLALSADFLAGDLIVLGGAAICAGGYVLGARVSPGIGAWPATCWQLAAALALLVPVLAWRADATDWRAVTASAWAGIAWMALLSSLIGYGLWFVAIEKGGIARIATWQFVQPVLTVAAAAMLLGEPITWPLVVAAAATLGGTVLAQRHAA